MASLFLSYKHEEAAYAFALRQHLIDAAGWRPTDIFVDVDHLHSGDEWERKILSQAEEAEIMLFIASEASLDPRSFCHKELSVAKRVVLAVTIKGLAPDDERLVNALPSRATQRQIAALDGPPTEIFRFASPKDQTTGEIGLNRRQVESIAETLRALGVAPDSFTWSATKEGPYPGLRALQEGEEALFFGRSLEVAEAIGRLERLQQTVTERAFLIQAPSGAGKSSFLRAGLWRRLRSRPAFTPLAVVRARENVLFHSDWGLAAGLAAHRKTSAGLARSEIEAALSEDPLALLARIADADPTPEGKRRTLLLGLDQAEEIAELSGEEDAALARFLEMLTGAEAAGLDIRLVLTAREDSVEQTLRRLERAGLARERVVASPLHRMAALRLPEVIRGPAETASRAGFPLGFTPQQVTALATAAAIGAGPEGGDALPILALALSRLVETGRRPDGSIVLDPQNAAAFLEGAIAATAEDALRDAGADQTDLRRLVIPRLALWDARAGEGGAAKRDVAHAADLFTGAREGLRPLADALVEKRLLTRSGEGAASVYEVAHEALLRVAPLGPMITALKAKYIRADILKVEAQDWREAGRDPERLARGGERLVDAEELLSDADFGDSLSDPALGLGEYLSACRAHWQKEQAAREEIAKRELEAARAREEAERDKAAAAERVAAASRRTAARTRLGAAAALVLAVAAGIAGWFALQSAEEAAARLEAAQITQSRFLTDLSRQQKEAGDTGAALALALAALPDEGKGPGGQQLSTRPFVEAAEGALYQALDALAERSVLRGHEDDVTSTAFSPDGRRILTGSGDKTARLWDAASGAAIAVLRGHEDTVESVAFSPDGRRILTGSSDGTARLWDAESGAEIAVLRGHDDRVTSAAFSPDGRRILTGSLDMTARLWDAASGAAIAVLRGHKNWVASAAFSPDGRRILTGSLDKTARLWDAASGAAIAVLRGHKGAVRSVAFSPDGRRVLTGSRDYTARLWDAASGAAIAVLRGHENRVASVAFSPDGRRILTGSGNVFGPKDNTARLWDAASGAEIAVLRGHAGSVQSVAFSPDGRRILTGSHDQTARLWDAASGAAIAVLRGHEGAVLSAAFSPDGRRILTGSRDETARLWDAASGAAIAVLRGHEDAVWSTAFSPDGRRILTGSGDKTARLWDAASGAAIAVLRGHEDAVLSAAFSPDGRRLLTGSLDMTARLWDPASGAEIAALRGHTGRVTSTAFSPDGRRILTGSWGKTARLWDAASGAEIAVLRGHEDAVTSAAFSPDGRRILTGSSDKTARLWDAASGAAIAVLRGHKDAVQSAAFSPDGRRILTGSLDMTARLWDAASGAAIAVLRGHEGAVLSAAFSPDGRRILTGSLDKTARLWDAASGAAIAVLRGHESTVSSVAFSPDGRRILTDSVDKTARLWDVESGAAIAVLRGHEDAVTSAAFSPDGRRILTGSLDMTARLWRVFPETRQALVDRAKRAAPRGLSPAQLEAFFLPPEPPRWYVTGAGLEAESDPATWRPLYPYHTPE